MKNFVGLAIGVSVVIGSFLLMSSNLQAANNMSHVHMDHVGTAWGDTPNGMGLLPTAIEEAKIAVQHAGAAAKKPDDLAWMKMHTAHVLHAIDPSIESTGPGLGYGLIKAATGAAKHINAAGKSDDASKNVQMHSVHVAQSAENAVVWGQEIIALVKKIMQTDDVSIAANLVKQISVISNQLLSGLDADGDGVVTWKQGEGGLEAANKHFGIMVKGENM